MHWPSFFLGFYISGALFAAAQAYDDLSTDLSSPHESVSRRLFIALAMGLSWPIWFPLIFVL